MNLRSCRKSRKKVALSIHKNVLIWKTKCEMNVILKKFSPDKINKEFEWNPLSWRHSYKEGKFICILFISDVSLKQNKHVMVFSKAPLADHQSLQDPDTLAGALQSFISDSLRKNEQESPFSRFARPNLFYLCYLF